MRESQTPYLPRLSFMPRPIVVRLLEHSRQPQTEAELLQDTDQLLDLTAMFRKTMSSTNSETSGLELLNAITPQQGNILQTQKASACGCTLTNYHILNCGHTVFTSTAWPSTFEEKSACASNCKTPTDRLDNERQEAQPPAIMPFICPMCIELSIRRAYIKTWKEFRHFGFNPASDPDVNATIWTYASVYALRKRGLRVTQGTSGIFRLNLVFEKLSLDFVPSVVSAMHRQWSYGEQNERSGRGRSRSPAREDRKVEEKKDRQDRSEEKKVGGRRVNIKFREERVAGPQQDLAMDGEKDVSMHDKPEYKELEKIKYRERNPLRVEHNQVLEEFVERLAELRVGMAKDLAVDVLADRIEAISAKFEEIEAVSKKIEMIRRGRSDR